MIYLVCRNRVKDFTHWKSIFDSHARKHRQAGLILTQMWQEVDDPSNIFFNFEVKDIEAAKAFLSASGSADTGQLAGVIDGEFHFVNSVPIEANF